MRSSSLTGLWRHAVVLPALACALLGTPGVAAATSATVPGPGAAHRPVAAATGFHRLSYLGYSLSVPRGWPVFRLGPGATTCVRFNRHAVYLGVPPLTGRCPSSVVGRSEAILVQPLSRASIGYGVTTVSGPGRAAPSSWPDTAAGAISFQVPAAGVLVTATWQPDPRLIRTVLGGASLIAGHASSERRVPVAAAAPGRAAPVVPSSAAGSKSAMPKPTVFSGQGFDGCTLPSTADLSAWSSSPYRAVAVYIGGENAGCPEPVTATWLKSVTALGWAVIPTFVGLQAPHNYCKCEGITPGKAYPEGLADASSALSEVKALGIPAGNPIYFDMEGYPSGKTNTPYVLSFLKAWTSRLHSQKYISGVYSNYDNGMIDLVSKFGTSGYTEPDDIWFADWNDEVNVTVSTIPAADWPSARMHQYNGGTDESYGGVTIDVNGDDCDGAVVAAASLSRSRS